MSTRKRAINFAKSFITDGDYRFRFLASKGFYKGMTDEDYLKKMFRASLGRELDLVHPITFNEKLQWLKLFDRKPEYTVMVDKYRVRDYIAKTIGEEYLIPLLGVWDSPDDINFDALPNQFVLKCNHNSGLGMCICRDKSILDIEKVKRDLRAGLADDYYYFTREWPYKDVPRKIICEKYMTDNGDQLSDYKVHNFNGIPKLILVCRDRFKNSGLTEDFYSDQWEHLDIRRPEHPNANYDIPMPAELQEMLKLSRVLSKGISFVRTDFYTIQGKVYFGEITFFPASGMENFEPTSIDEKLGGWLSLPTEGGTAEQK